MNGITRRLWMGGAAAIALGSSAARAEDRFAGLARTFAQIEAERGGRLGVAVLDTGSGRRAGYRQDERFAMCSTFKLLLAGAVLARADAGKERMDRRIVVTRQDLAGWSPATEKNLGGEGMTLTALCDAAVALSDNGAANLLLRTLGGPEGLTAYVRTLGDTVTRLDRWETALNEAIPGDPRDTTTPAAMLADMQALTLGNALSAASREQLVTWMRASKTGDKRLRARLPRGWQEGNKTGTGERRTSNVVGILWPPGGRPPVLVAAYLTEGAASAETRDAALADVGAAVAAALT
jgi:beta-lactamase class A